MYQHDVASVNHFACGCITESILDYCNSILFSLKLMRKKQAPDNQKHFDQA